MSNNNNIHSSSVISSKAKLGANVKVGAFCIIGDDVEIGDNSILESHVVITGKTKLGKNNHIFPFASIGHKPQDLKYHGEQSEVIIGDNNQIREYVTINPGTEGGGMKTIIGSNCLLMIGVHVAHDCIVGNNVIMANNATLAGHVVVGDFAVIGGLAAIHQFVRIGSHAMIGGMSGIENDVIPYGSAMGERANLAGLNIIGLKRRNFSKEEINAVRHAFKMIFEDDNGTFDDRVSNAKKEFASSNTVMQMIDFIRSDSSRNICQIKK